jgi:hypothetical protein
VILRFRKKTKLDEIKVSFRNFVKLSGQNFVKLQKINGKMYRNFEIKILR